MFITFLNQHVSLLSRHGTSAHVFSTVLISQCTRGAFIVPLRSRNQRCSVRKSLFRNLAKFTGKHLSQSFFFVRLQDCNFVKKDTLAQVFSWEFYEILKNTFLQNSSGRLLVNIFFTIKISQVTMKGPNEDQLSFWMS